MDVRVMDNVHWKMANIIVNASKAGPARTVRYRSRWTVMMESIMTKVREGAVWTLSLIDGYLV